MTATSSIRESRSSGSRRVDLRHDRVTTHDVAVRSVGQRRSRAGQLGLAALLLCSACGLVLGIEDKPLRETGDVVDASSDAAAVDARGDGGPPGPDCQRNPPGCSCEPHDFCDDFDTPGPLLRTWVKPPIGGSDPLIIADGSVGLTSEAFSPPSALHAFAATSNDLAGAAFALHVLGRADASAGRVVGVKLTSQVRIVSVSVETPPDTVHGVGPIPGAGCAGIGGLGLAVSATQLAGVGFILANKALYLAASDNLVIGSTPAQHAVLFETDITALSTSYLSLELIVTDRTRAMALGPEYEAACASVEDGPVAAATLKLYKSACIPLKGELANLDRVLETPVLSTGGLVYNVGSLVVHHDNVTGDFLVE